MAKDKTLTLPEAYVPQEEDVCVFPEGHVMNEWSASPSRDRNAREGNNNEERRPRRHITKDKGKFFIPREWWPAGYQLGWMTEYVLNVPQGDNLRSRQMDGWEFVHSSEIPQLPNNVLNHEFDRGRDDGRIRNGGCILMKMPLEEYLQEQEEYREDGEEIRRQSAALTDYLGAAPGREQFLVNDQKYEPAFKHRRG
jgi:hypothetical protein